MDKTSNKRVITFFQIHNIIHPLSEKMAGEFLFYKVIYLKYFYNT